MATSGAGSVLDTTNYQIDKDGGANSPVALPSGTSISLGNTGKEVVITLGSLTGINAGTTQIFATVNAADGKPISATNNMKTVTAIDASAVVEADIQKIKLVDKKTITFEVKKPLSGVDAADIRLAAANDGSGGIPADTASYVNQTLEDGTYGAVVTVVVAGTTPANTLSTGLISTAPPYTNKLDNIDSSADQNNNLVLLAGALTNELGAANAADILITPGELTIADNAAPYLVSAATGDVDGDGELDRLIVTFSEELYAPSVQETDFEVDGYAVGSVLTVSGKDVILILDEKGTLDTGAKPDVKVIDDILDNSSNRNAVSSTDFVKSADGAAPRAIIPAVTGTDNSETKLVITLSEALRDAATDVAIADGASLAANVTSADATLGTVIYDLDTLTITITITAAADGNTILFNFDQYEDLVGNAGTDITYTYASATTKWN
jgi:hypothetical protein